MIDVRSIANTASNVVNSNIYVTLRISDGYTIGTGRKQEPAYLPDISGVAQMQALDGQDLKQLDGLNIQGKIKALYLTGDLAGVLRTDSKGGDIVIIDGRTWLVVKVLEGWATWTKAAIQLQSDA